MGRKERVILGGFTLIELLIVIVIIAILSSVAIPTYIRTVEKARAGEAITNLTLIRAGEKVYRLEYGNYRVNLADASGINPALNLDIEPRFWIYNVGDEPSPYEFFTSIATRDSGRYIGTTIKINQAGWDGTGTSDFQPQQP